ncbi:MAG: sulfotransferase [Sphingomonadales bacterium]|nr:sulfotransferase [Sphingomonadales bacterium]
MTITGVDDCGPPVEEAQRALVGRARLALQRGDFPRAIAACQTVLGQSPDHRDALYTLAATQRYAGQVSPALATIERLLQSEPGYGRAHQERAHCLRALGREREAMSAYQAAVGFNNGLLGSWQMLAQFHAGAGQAGAAEFARAQCAYLESLPPELLGVVNLIGEADIGAAESLCRAFLQKHRHHTEAMRLLAEIGTRFNSFDEAEFLLESCVVLDAANTNAHLDYVNLLSRRQKFEAALEQAKALRAKKPGDGQFETLYANQCLALGEFDEALAILARQLERMPNNPVLHLSHGHALKTTGRQAEAISAYRHAYAVRPDFGDAYWSLANLKTYRFERDEIDRMRDIEDRSETALVDRYHLCFALGKALEDGGDHAGSFGYYERGNGLKRDEVGYDWRRITADLALQRQHCGPELFERFKGAGCASAEPIFILGLPRAGSTLLEQILASHSQVEGTLELPNILSLAHRIEGPRRVGEDAAYPANLADLTAEQLATFGAEFIRDTRVHRKLGKTFFIDKMPNNFRHIGLIKLILPNAKIIDARRAPLDCCFSGFKQLFAEGQEFTYGLEQVGHYYHDYVHLMRHWHDVLPGQILHVQYEDVVADTETQVRRILDYLGLPFEPACLEFHKTERVVRTASSEQVRQPINTRGIEAWAPFEPWLDPLKAALGDVLEDYRR